MKKYLLSFAVMLMGTSLLTGCLGSDDDNNTPAEYVVTKGVLVINNGNYYNGIDGSLTFVDFGSNPFSVQQNVYKSANGECLGGTPNDVLAYGEKIYIVGSDENTVFVLNAKTFRLIEKINLVQEMGEADGVNPRALDAYGSKVYVSTYGGCVAVIDTGSVTLPPHYESLFRVGSAPEGLAIGGTSDSDLSLYVANSDYGNGNGSISKISLANGSITEIKNDKIHNPQKLAIAGNVIYVLDWGYYDENWMQQEAGVYRINGSTVSKIIPDATDMTASGQIIYTYNYPYGSTAPTYSAYNVAYSTLISFKLSGGDPIVSPSAISVDPNKGYLYIASRKMDPDTGYPAYSLPGFVNIYSVNDLGSGVANFVDTGTFATGVEPHVITFTYGIAKLQY